MTPEDYWWKRLEPKNLNAGGAKRIAGIFVLWPWPTRNRCIISGQMSTGLRAMASLGLSVWMSALACLVGCGQTFASSRINSDADSAKTAMAEMPCCHHSQSSAPSHPKKQDSIIVSCCLPDAISQKTAADLDIKVVAQAPILGAAIDVADNSYTAPENPLHARLHGGRETILQSRLLRI